MHEKAGETWEETTASVSQLLENKLQLPTVDLERAHRVGLVMSSQPRAVVVRFEKFQDREAVLGSERKLKGTGIYVNEDLCPASQEIKKSHFPQMKQARQDGKIAYFRHTRLIIKERAPHQRSTPVAASSPVSARAESQNVYPAVCGVGAVRKIGEPERAAVEDAPANVKVTPKADGGVTVKSTMVEKVVTQEVTTGDAVDPSGDADSRATGVSTGRPAGDAVLVSPEATSLPDDADGVKGLEDTDVEASGVTTVRHQKNLKSRKK